MKPTTLPIGVAAAWLALSPLGAAQGEVQPVIPILPVPGRTERVTNKGCPNKGCQTQNNH